MRPRARPACAHMTATLRRCATRSTARSTTAHAATARCCGPVRGSTATTDATLRGSSRAALRSRAAITGPLHLDKRRATEPPRSDRARPRGPDARVARSRNRTRVWLREPATEHPFDRTPVRVPLGATPRPGDLGGPQFRDSVPVIQSEIQSRKINSKKFGDSVREIQSTI